MKKTFKLFISNYINQNNLEGIIFNDESARLITDESNDFQPIEQLSWFDREIKGLDSKHIVKHR
jgi:hypothetical protein